MSKTNGRVIIVHGWNNKPDHGWLGWLATELEARGYEVLAPAMPLTHTPSVAKWTATLARAAGSLDPRTVIVGYSLGTAVSLKFLNDYVPGVRIAGLVMVAGFGEGIGRQPAALFDPPLDYARLRLRARTRICIYSSNDRVVLPRYSHRLASRLKANERLIVDAGHFMAVPRMPGYRETLPVVLDAVLACIEEPSPWKRATGSRWLRDFTAFVAGPKKTPRP